MAHQGWYRFVVEATGSMNMLVVEVCGCCEGKVFVIVVVLVKDDGEGLRGDG